MAAVLIPTQVLGWLLMFGIPQAGPRTSHGSVRSANSVMSSWDVHRPPSASPIVALIWPFVPSLLSDYPPVTVDFFRAFLVASLLVLPSRPP